MPHLKINRSIATQASGHFSFNARWQNQQAYRDTDLSANLITQRLTPSPWFFKINTTCERPNGPSQNTTTNQSYDRTPILTGILNGKLTSSVSTTEPVDFEINFSINLPNHPSFLPPASITPLLVRRSVSVWRRIILPPPIWRRVARQVKPERDHRADHRHGVRAGYHRIRQGDERAWDRFGYDCHRRSSRD